MTTDPAFWHRLQFAFTVTYHYLFPQLTMGVVWFLVYWTWRGQRPDGETAAAAARFWFIGALLWGGERLGPHLRLAAAVGVAAGSWLSGYFIIVTNAFMQRPAGHVVTPDGRLALADLGAYLFNEWAWIEFAHNQAAALVIGSFAVAAVGAFYALRGEHMPQARLYLKHGTLAGLVASVLVAFPTGDAQAKIVARYQEPALAAMEGRFESGPMADITLIGQPNVAGRRLDNPLRVPGLLSFPAFGTFHRDVRGLNAFPEEEWAGR